MKVTELKNKMFVKSLKHPFSKITIQIQIPELQNIYTNLHLIKTIIKCKILMFNFFFRIKYI